MFCKNCGAQLQDGTKFCPKCGTGVGEGQQAGVQPESQQRTGGETTENASKPRQPVKKAATASTKRKALIGAGAGIGIVGIIVLLIVVFFPKSGIRYYFYTSGNYEKGFEGGAVIAGYDGAGSVVKIPSEIKDHSETRSVTKIDMLAFRDCSNLVKVEIPDSVTYIGARAFSGCSSLTSIEIPNSVTTIDGGAFEGCSSLTSIKISDSVREIKTITFSGCSSLTSIEIPDSVMSVGARAFSGCSSLTSIEIRGSAFGIGESAFEGCSSLTSIKLPNVGTIEENAFSGCSSLESIEIKGVRYIEDGAFSGCSSLTKVIIANIPDSLSPNAFDSLKQPDIIIIAGIEVPYEKIQYGGWEEYIGKTTGSSGGYTRFDFVSDQAYQDYLDFGDTSGLKK